MNLGTRYEPETLAAKIWRQHLVGQTQQSEDLVYIDRVFLHERSGAIALKNILEEGHPVRNRSQVFATVDHIVDTFPGRISATMVPSGELFFRSYRESAEALGIEVFDVDDDRQGIVHVVAAEQGIALPGSTLVCADSHTCSLGALGAFAWGVGTTDIQCAIASNVLPRRFAKQALVRINGRLKEGVTAKDVVLALIGKFGADGAQGSIVEFGGDGAAHLEIEERLTLCNMAVEFDAWTGLIAPDDKVFEFLSGTPFAPKGALWDRAISDWRLLRTDHQAQFDFVFDLECADLEPQVSWGTSPEHVVGISGVVPDPSTMSNPSKRSAAAKALEYTRLRPGQPMSEVEIDAAFLGSCTNGRISDLRSAAKVLKGRKIKPGLTALCVPGSTQVKQQAEAEGLDTVFKDAGFEWRESGCSLCFYAGGDGFGSAKRIISSTNRNFEGRQGPGKITHIASPLTVAASAIAGTISHPDILAREAADAV